MPNFYFDEDTQLHIAYELYDGDVNVFLSDCFYEGTNDMPLPSDLGMDTKRELVRYLENIIAEYQDMLYNDCLDEDVAESRWLDQHLFN